MALSKRAKKEIESAFSFKPITPSHNPGEWISHKYEGPGTEIIPKTEEEVWKLKKEPEHIDTPESVIEEEQQKELSEFALLVFGNKPIAWYESEDVANNAAHDVIADFEEGRGIFKEYIRDQIGIMTIPFQPYVTNFLEDFDLSEVRRKIGYKLVRVYKGEGFMPNPKTVLNEDELPNPYNNLSTWILQTISPEVKSNFFRNLKSNSAVLFTINQWIYSKSFDGNILTKSINSPVASDNNFFISKRAENEHKWNKYKDLLWFLPNRKEPPAGYMESIWTRQQEGVKEAHISLKPEERAALDPFGMHKDIRLNLAEINELKKLRKTSKGREREIIDNILKRHIKNNISRKYVLPTQLEGSEEVDLLSPKVPMFWKNPMSDYYDREKLPMYLKHSDIDKLIEFYKALPEKSEKRPIIKNLLKRINEQKNPKDYFQYDVSHEESKDNVPMIDLGHKYEMDRNENSEVNKIILIANKLGWPIPIVEEERQVEGSPTTICKLPGYLTDNFGRKVRLNKFLETAKRKLGDFTFGDGESISDFANGISVLYERTPKITNWDLVISAEPSDILTMSTGRGWKSCVSEGGCNFASLDAAIDQRDLVAYAIDPNTKKWVSRVWLRFDGKGNWWPEAKVYDNTGLSKDIFINAVTKYLSQRNILGEIGEYSPIAKGWTDTYKGYIESNKDIINKKIDEMKERYIPEEPYSETGEKEKTEMFKINFQDNLEAENGIEGLRKISDKILFHNHQYMFYDKSNTSIFVTMPSNLFEFVKSLPSVRSINRVGGQIKMVKLFIEGSDSFTSNLPNRLLDHVVAKKLHCSTENKAMIYKNPEYFLTLFPNEKEKYDSSFKETNERFYDYIKYRISFEIKPEKGLCVCSAEVPHFLIPAVRNMLGSDYKVSLANKNFFISKRASKMICPHCYENVSNMAPEKNSAGLYKIMTCPSCKNYFYPQDAMVQINDKHELDVGNWLEHGIYMLWWGGYPIALYKTRQHADRARTSLINDFTRSGKRPDGTNSEAFLILLNEKIRTQATKDSDDETDFFLAGQYAREEAPGLLHPLRQKGRKEYAEGAINISKVPSTIKPKRVSEGDLPSLQDVLNAQDFGEENDEILQHDRIDSAKKENEAKNKFVEQAAKNVQKKIKMFKEEKDKEKLADDADDSFKWIKPSLADETNELLRTSIEEHIPFDSLKRSFNNGVLKPLDRKVWQHLDNTDSLPIRSIEEAIALAENYGKDWSKIKQAFDNNKSLPSPIILERNDGSIYLIGGNTRLAFARAYHVKPWAYWIKETELFKSPHSLD